MQIGNALANKGWNRSTALKRGWEVAKLKARMRKGFTRFGYIKVNGETRPATGTTCPALIDYQAKGGRPSRPDVIRYFDADKNAFRSFKADRLAYA